MPHDETPSTHEPQSDEQSGMRREGRVRKTRSRVLLECAISSLGAAALADALGVTSRDIERISSEGRTMTLAQQRVLAMAVLTLSDGHPDLRRRAAALLGQVRAVDEFESRATERHTFPPRVRWR